MGWRFLLCVCLIRHIHRYENLDWADVKRIEFQARPYDYRITFHGVSLSPEHETHVEVTVEKPGSLLPGNSLPSFDGIDIDLPKEAEGRAWLICFFDFQQRPSRQALLQLAGQVATLERRGVQVIGVQAAQTDHAELDAWRKDNQVSFPVGTVAAHPEQRRSTWGVRALPWLILADKEHVVVVAGGLSLDELDEIGE
ncbi:MAG: redoxin domain-containing protein [Sedimentisphaerales bacterium]|nr:redoxin domain-containing protein [Sedimentisphaerales bacterium]